jgi:hypothetical protein
VKALHFKREKREKDSWRLFFRRENGKVANFNIKQGAPLNTTKTNPPGHCANYAKKQKMHKISHESQKKKKKKKKQTLIFLGVTISIDAPCFGNRFFIKKNALFSGLCPFQFLDLRNTCKI